MAFVQLIEFIAENEDAVREIDEQWLAATEGKRTARRQIVTRDRNNADRYVVAVFFDSYDSAMTNSALPETQTLAEKYRAVTTEIAFHDLDVISDTAL